MGILRLGCLTRSSSVQKLKVEGKRYYVQCVGYTQFKAVEVYTQPVTVQRRLYPQWLLDATLTPMDMQYKYTYIIALGLELLDLHCVYVPMGEEPGSVASTGPSRVECIEAQRFPHNTNWQLSV